MNRFILEYQRNFAAFMYGDDDHQLSNKEKYYVDRLFKRIPADYHEAVAEYPVWLSNNYDDVVTMRDWRRYKASGQLPYFLFSVPRIEKYLFDQCKVSCA